MVNLPLFVFITLFALFLLVVLFVIISDLQHSSWKVSSKLLWHKTWGEFHLKMAPSNSYFCSKWATWKDSSLSLDFFGRPEFHNVRDMRYDKSLRKKNMCLRHWVNSIKTRQGKTQIWRYNHVQLLLKDRITTLYS